jgi:hypothetical protein
MIRLATICRWGFAVTVAGVLLGCGTSCQPAGTTGGAAPSTSKSNKPPDDKGHPGKQPKPDVGRAHPFGASPVRAMRSTSPLTLAA